MNSKTDRLPHVLRHPALARALGTFVVLMAVTLAPAGVRAAATVPPASLAQVPQFLQFPPAPNVFITVDNSGSMADEVLPDTNIAPRMFPITMATPYDTTGDGQFTDQLTGALGFTGFSHTLEVARRRSSDVNLMYYNPRIRYLPWQTADNTGAFARLPAADPRNALYHPLFPARGGLDLTQGRIKLNRYDVLEAGPNYNTDLRDEYRARYTFNDNSAPDAPFALYYVYNAACTATNPTTTLSCYTRVEITSGTANYTIPPGNQRGIDEVGCGTNTSGVMVCNYVAELQNFANWFQYYRARTLLARGAMSNTMADLGSGFRVGLGLLNSNQVTVDTFYASNTVQIGVRDFSGVNRFPWYQLLQNHEVTGRTPSGRALMEVGNYFDAKEGNQPHSKGPWSDLPGTGSTVFASCRQSYHVFATDGYWNETIGSLFAGVANAATGADNKDAPGYICPPGVDPAAPTDKCYRYKASSAGDNSAAAIAAFDVPGPNNLFNQNNLRFNSSASQTLADIAMYFWYRDLQPQMDNNVAPSSADPAFWQHLSLLAVALGFTGTKTDLGETFLTGLDNGASDASGAPYAWPTNITPLAPETADDLWHAAVNSRGRLFVAGNPQELSARLTAALQEISARSAVGAAAASSTAFLSTDSGIFTAEIQQGTWSGNLYRREIVESPPNSGNFKFKDTVGTTPLPRDANGVPYIWRASDQLAAPTARPIFTMRSATGSTAGGETAARGLIVDFAPNGGPSSTGSGVDTTQQTALNAPTGELGADVINYIRGDRTKEQTNGGTMRDRPKPRASVPGSGNNVIGTIANAAPIFVKDDDFNYDNLPTGALGKDTYLTFLRSNQSSTGRAGTIWAGSNDGMLHAFDPTSGNELFAYVPREVIQNLSVQVDPKYSHRFMVDGVPSAADAYIATKLSPTASWRTVVTGSLGAGGRAVFAIDATNPTNLGADSVMWEVGQQSLAASDYQLLGSNLGPVLVARVKDSSMADGGRWVAVFGNGPESDLKRAALFVVDLATGDKIAILDTGVGDTASPNGLFTPAPLFDSNRQLIAVYAGDVLGNLWKFDLSSVSKTDPSRTNPSVTPTSFSSNFWFVAFDGKPLFTASAPSLTPPGALGKPQSIFMKPLLRRHPDGGVMVIFGTGKIYSPGDRDNADVQTFYGIWDKPGAAELSGDFRATGSSLVQQAIKQKTTDSTDGKTRYFITNAAVDPTTKRGWFLDLGVTYPVTGNTVSGTGTSVTPRERMIVTPAMLGSAMIAQSFIPSTDSCDIGGQSFLFRLDPMTGGLFASTDFGRNGAGAQAIPGTIGILNLLERGAQGSGTRTGVNLNIDIKGGLTGFRFDLGGLGTFRTWRQLLD